MVTVKKPNHLLRYEREKRGMSQRKLADLLDTSEEMVSRWERGERKTAPSTRKSSAKSSAKMPSL